MITAKLFSVTVVLLTAYLANNDHLESVSLRTYTWRNNQCIDDSTQRRNGVATTSTACYNLECCGNAASCRNAGGCTAGSSNNNQQTFAGNSLSNFDQTSYNQAYNNGYNYHYKQRCNTYYANDINCKETHPEGGECGFTCSVVLGVFFAYCCPCAIITWICYVKRCCCFKNIPRDTTIIAKVGTTTYHTENGVTTVTKEKKVRKRRRVKRADGHSSSESYSGSGSDKKHNYDSSRHVMNHGHHDNHNNHHGG